MSIVVVGSIAFDSVETNHGKAEHVMGGAALYFSHSASYFSQVNLVGVVGSDFDLNQIDYLSKKNVDLSGIEVQEGKTFRWGGRYHSNMNDRTTMFTELNVFADFQPKIPEHFKKSDIVFLANIHPSLQLDVLNQVQHPKLVVLDTMNFWISGARETLMTLLKQVNILIINDEEARELAGDDNLMRATRTIRGMGPDTLIVKKGENGAMMFNKNSVFAMPAFPLEEVIDPTGAGDTFAGGFVGYLDQKKEFNEEHLKKAIVYGSVMASFVCEDFSFNKLKSLDLKYIDERVDKFRKITQF